MKMKKLVMTILAIMSLGVFVTPAWALFYSAPGPYELTVNGNYTEQNNSQGTGGPGGCSANLCGYVPADFAKSNMFNGAGNGTIYNFTFTIGSSTTDYLNISRATGTEEFLVTSYTCGSSGVSGCGSSAPFTSSGTLFSGPTTIDDPSGLSLAFSAGGSAVNYLVQVQLNNGDDPTNYITLTSTPTYAPLPGTLPLFAGGLGVLGLLGWRRKRKTRFVG